MPTLGPAYQGSRKVRQPEQNQNGAQIVTAPLRLQLARASMGRTTIFPLCPREGSRRPRTSHRHRGAPWHEAIFGILGGVDGFDEDEAESKGHNGAVVLGRLLAAERNSLEALELTDKLLDAGARPIERFRKECRPVLG
jgi:hypothetical protein